MKVYTVEGPSDEAYGARLLVVGVEDAITPDGVDKKWAVDAEALLGKLRGIGLAEIYALADAGGE
ncbi:hypothetical protein [Rhodocaloribacter sp.]